MAQVIILKNAKETVTALTNAGLMDIECYFSTYQVLRNAVNRPPDGGFTVEEMMKRGRLLNYLDPFKNRYKYPVKIVDTNEIPVPISEIDEEFLTHTDELTMEDADAEYMIELFKKFKFDYRSEFVIELNEQLKAVSENLKSK